MNENAELIKYLDIAENVYENMYEKGFVAQIDER